MELSFHVGPGVLVPRPDSEVLVETALALSEKISCEKLAVLDACTGTGCVGISLAHRLLLKNRLARLCLTEIDPTAAYYARLNLADYQLAGKAELLITDLVPPGEYGPWI
jgi:release factor glutamine methyltransferase